MKISGLKSRGEYGIGRSRQELFNEYLILAAIGVDTADTGIGWTLANLRFLRLWWQCGDPSVLLPYFHFHSDNGRYGQEKGNLEDSMRSVRPSVWKWTVQRLGTKTVGKATNRISLGDHSVSSNIGHNSLGRGGWRITWDTPSPLLAGSSLWLRLCKANYSAESTETAPGWSADRFARSIFSPAMPHLRLTSSRQLCWRQTVHVQWSLHIVRILWMPSKAYCHLFVFKPTILGLTVHFRNKT